MQSQFFKSWKKSMRWPKGDFRQEKHEIGEEHQNQEADIERKEEKPEAVIKTEENTEEVCESIKQKGDFRMCRDALFCDGTSSCDTARACGRAEDQAAFPYGPE